MYLAADISDIDVVLGGLIVVFAGMTAIVGLLYAISGIFRFFESKKKNKIVLTLEAEELPSADVNEAKADDVSEEELIAVISAAVSAYLGGESAPRFKVTSFKRVGRSLNRD